MIILVNVEIELFNMLFMQIVIILKTMNIELSNILPKLVKLVPMLYLNL